MKKVLSIFIKKSYFYERMYHAIQHKPKVQLNIKSVFILHTRELLYIL